MESLEEFSLGGVDASVSSDLEVKAAVSYYTPYTIDGQPVTVSIGLANNAAANTIIGLPFLRATRAALFLDDKAGSSLVLQKLGTTLPITYHPPLMADTAPKSGTEDGAAYLVTSQKKS
jgi:hypothetical protein